MNTNMESRPVRAAAEEAAAAWLLRQDTAEWSAANQGELDRWLLASPSHRVAYMRLQMIWRDTGRLKSLSAGLPKGQVPARGAIEQSPFFAIRRGDTEGVAAGAVSESASTWGRVKRYAVAASVAAGEACCAEANSGAAWMA